MTENYTGQKAQTQKEPRRWERRPAEQAGKGGEQAAGEASSRKKPQPTASFPSPPRSPLLRLGLQLQAYTNGALIATGNLSGRGGGGSWASRRHWGPGCTPLSWPPTQSQPPSCPAPSLHPCFGPHPSFTPPFSLLLPPPPETPSPYCPSGGTPKLGLTLRVGLLALKCPLFTFLREGFGRKGEFSMRNSEPLILQLYPEGGRRGERRGA